MAKSVNRVCVLGNVGKQPDIRHTPSGTAMASFSIACNEKFKDKGGEWQERTEWVNIKAWSKLAEVVEKYVDKGKQIYVEGRLNTESWEKDGQKHYKTVVVASDIVLLGGKGDGGGRAEQEEGGGFESAPQQQEDNSGVPF